MKLQFCKTIFNLYYEGFTNMGFTGRKLWMIVFIKLFIMFAVLKLFFFPDFLKSKFKTNTERGNYVIEQLIQSKR
jgi:hypothetical protein